MLLPVLACFQLRFQLTYSVVFERCQSKGSNIYTTSAPLCFGFGLHIHMFLFRSICQHAGENTLRLELSSGQMKILPLQSQDFTTPESSHQCQDIKSFPFVSM